MKKYHIYQKNRHKKLYSFSLTLNAKGLFHKGNYENQKCKILKF